MTQLGLGGPTKKPEPEPKKEPIQFSQPFDPHVQKVINSVHSKIAEKTGIEREEFKGLRFCQYVCEEIAYYVKFHQEEEKYMHVKIAKPFTPSMQENWEVPYDVTEVRMDKKEDEKVRVWDKEANCMDRRRRDDFYDADTWDAPNIKLGLIRPKLDLRKFEKMSALAPN